MDYSCKRSVESFIRICVETVHMILLLPELLSKVAPKVD
jgi:hypothetical protein